MIIYKATNKVNGKCYIGSTSYKLEIRKYKHFYESLKRNSNKVFHRAIRKYGKENFDWEILAEASSKDEMLKLEYDFIEKFDTYKNGYNSTKGFDNTTLGYKYTKEQKQKISERMKGENNPNFGNKWTDEQKRMASIKAKESHKHLRGKNSISNRPEVRKKLSLTKMGKLNPRAIEWNITYPNGKQIILNGGIKRFLKENGLTYMMVQPMLKGKTETYKGWKIKRKE